MSEMTKEQKQLLVTGILVIILGVVMYNSFSSMGKSAPKAPAKAAPGPVAAHAPAVTPSLSDAAKLSAQRSGKDDAWGRDPFGSQEGKPDERVETLTLQGVTVGNGTGYAFINNLIVRKGDRFGNLQVADVLKDKVLLQKGDQKFYLNFPEK